MEIFPALKPWLPWLFIASVVMFVGTLIIVPLLIVRMPADYFVQRQPALDSWRRQHPFIRYGVRVIKNFVGGLFLIIGLVMLLTPGQGILSLIIGLSLLDIPGKRKLEIGLLRRPVVLRSINSLRRRAGQSPLELPPTLSDATGSELPSTEG